MNKNIAVEGAGYVGMSIACHPREIYSQPISKPNQGEYAFIRDESKILLFVGGYNLFLCTFDKFS